MGNVKKLEFIPTLYGRGPVERVLDRSFKEFGQTIEEESLSVDKFFQDYEDLFYQIPVEGEVNSHQYLVEKSSQMYKAGSEMDVIQPLLDEINLLRSQSIQDQKTIVELQLKLNSGETN